ncbi:MAG: hypothetical protein ACOYIK_03905 [Coriobacteriales bacterium]
MTIRRVAQNAIPVNIRGMACCEAISLDPSSENLNTLDAQAQVARQVRNKRTEAAEPAFPLSFDLRACDELADFERVIFDEALLNSSLN